MQNGQVGVKKRGRVLLALYGFTCIFAHFFSLGFCADKARELYFEFANKYEEAVLFALGSESKINLSSGVILGIAAGSITSVLIYFASRERSHYRAGVMVFMSYAGVFAVSSLIGNPAIFRSIIDSSYMLMFAVICGLTTALAISFQKERKRGTLSKNFFLKELELEHTQLREVFHALIWTFIMAFIGIFAGWGYQYFFRMPFEIAYSEAFHWYIFPQLIMIGLIFLGFWLGILLQILFEMNDITAAIRRSLRKKNQR